MAACCSDCHTPDPQRGNEAYRRILWAVPAINAARGSNPFGRAR